MTITDTHVQSFFTSVRHKKILSFLKDTPDLKLSVLARLVCRRDGESALSDNGINWAKPIQLQDTYRTSSVTESVPGPRYCTILIFYCDLSFFQFIKGSSF